MRWHRSLYWRVALGVVAFLAAMLVVQAVLFVWAVSQSGRSLPGQSPARLSMTVALDLSNQLERDPATDLAQYVRDQYAQYAHPFFVLMADGRLITSGSRTFSEPLLAIARARLARRDVGFGRSRMGPGGPRFPSERFEPPLRSGERLDRFEGEAGPARVRPSAIMANGQMVGVVVVPPQAPFGFLLGRYAPMLALVAAGVLIVGTVLTSLMIFGPARRRLLALESAARQFGAGDLSARAPEKGGDEIAAVATAFNAMADDLAARAEALASADRLRRQLLADVSHELNTPVTTMRGYLETLAMPELKLDEAARTRYLGIITDETARLERVIGDLLDLARLEGGGGALRLERVPLDQLLARILARHEKACAEAGVTVQTEIEPEAAVVTADRDRIEQALQNLAANAIRYAPRGTAVRVRARPGPDGVVLSVEDEGPGIAPEHLSRVFDRFYKADSARTGLSGSGLGLSIVKAIVERHGGRITVQSRPGRTVFEMVLPSTATEQRAGVGADDAAGRPARRQAADLVS